MFYPGNSRKRTKFFIDQTLYKTKCFIGGNYEIEKPQSGPDRKLHYISGGDGIFAIFVQEGSKNTMYYIHKDYLGSYYCVTSDNGIVIELNNVEQIYSFDPWGRRRNHTDWSYENVPISFLFDRGFTGHEHLDAFELINMNGRVYDPMLGRMLSPDNFVQAPTFSQNYNRYSYALNNPLVYTDPDGEFFVIDSWLVGFIHGFFSSGNNRFRNAWKGANHRAGNDAKIWGGLFVTDPNKNFGGQVWEVFSRFTWQLPQTIGGWGTAQSYNTFGLQGGVASVEYKYGATVVTTRKDWTAVTQGSYIVGGNSLKADANNPLFQHEYGHYIQSQTSGWFYYSKYGIPSALSKDPHNQHPVEQDANVRAFRYFSKHVDGFNWVDKWGNQQSNWIYWYNPINGYDWSHSFSDPTNQAALKNGRLRLSWYDYLLGPNIVVSGLLNTLILNHQY